MMRYEIIAPAVKNDSSVSNYAQAFREALLDNYIEGWTEWETVGYWMGKAEPGTMFTIFHTLDITGLLSNIARKAMPDQEAIQVVTSPVPSQLVEA